MAQEAAIERIQELAQELKEAHTPSKKFELSADIALLGELQQFLPGATFPAPKEEVASEAESKNAPQELVQQIRNANTERFNSPDEVLQAVQGRL